MAHLAGGHYIRSMNSPNIRVVDELQKMLADFEVLAKAAMAAAGDQAGGAAEELSSSLNAARARLAEFEMNVGHQFKHGARKADGYVHDRPWMAVGIAAAAAFLLGVAVARRD
jgi:ElaB/YqjD/DUF883 family membrane-anchored ribosome-binding protein